MSTRQRSMWTLEREASAPEPQRLLEQIDDLGPTLAANALAMESQRRIAEESIEALEAIGAFRVLSPLRHGGFGMSACDSMEVLAKLAEFSGSTAWVVMVINNCNWQASHLPLAGQKEIFADESPARVAGSMLPHGRASRVEGGYLVSGRWPWASGSWHANWGQLGIMIDGPTATEPERAVAYAPMANLKIEETWFVAGMQGTGSNTLVATDLFVPLHRTYATSYMLDQEYVGEHPDDPSSSSAFVPTLFLGFAGVQLGLARAALRHVIETAPVRPLTGTQIRQSESTALQIEVARAAQLIETAHLHVFRAADAVDEFADRSTLMPYLERARARSDIAYAVSRVVEAIGVLLTVHGASSFADVNPLQRIWRDSETAARHVATIPFSNLEIYGKALLGVSYEQNVTRMI